MSFQLKIHIKRNFFSGGARATNNRTTWREIFIVFVYLRKKIESPRFGVCGMKNILQCGIDGTTIKSCLDGIFDLLGMNIGEILVQMFVIFGTLKKSMKLKINL